MQLLYRCNLSVLPIPLETEAREGTSIAKLSYQVPLFASTALLLQILFSLLFAQVMLHMLTVQLM